MAKPLKTITPENRLPHWRRLWATPKKLDSEATEAAFEEFQEGLVPRHMHKIFLKSFGGKKDQLNNRFFRDDAVFSNWNAKLSDLVPRCADVVEVTVIYGSPEALEGHQLKGQSRRSLKDIIVDDWQAGCAIVRSDSSTLYIFVDVRMRGCITRLERPEEEPADDLDV